jgi:hypothetical protein
MVADLLFIGAIAGLTLIVFLMVGDRNGGEASWQASIRRRVLRERLEAEVYVNAPEPEELERAQAERDAIEARLEEERKVSQLVESR